MFFNKTRFEEEIEFLRDEILRIEKNAYEQNRKMNLLLKHLNVSLVPLYGYKVVTQEEAAEALIKNMQSVPQGVRTPYKQPDQTGGEYTGQQINSAYANYMQQKDE